MQSTTHSDSRTALRDLARQYMAVCESERNRHARALWRDHNSLRPGRPLVICSVFFASAIEHEIESAIPPLVNEHGPLRDLEYWLRTRLWASTIPDDQVYDPWYFMMAEMLPPPEDFWGVKFNMAQDSDSRGYRFLPVIKTLEDLDKLKAAPHKVINEETDAIKLVRETIGDILPVHVSKMTVYPIWLGTDLAMAAGALLGLEELMYLICEKPELVHGLMAFMRDAVLANLEQGEAAGDWSTVENVNYGMPPHAHELPEPKPNSYGASLKDLWFFTHAQEFEGTGPAQHDEFLLQYQMPIMEKFGLVNYGCCETLDHKIDMLRKIPNLRRILMGPTANLKHGCEQIGRDYVVSWRPNPAMVSAGFDEDNVRRSIREGFRESAGCNVEVMLKEMMTLEGDVSRLFRWTEIAQEEAQAV